jgi:hypothetical protein
MTTRDNEQMIERARKRLRKRAKRGLRGYPVATAALYGPDDTRATKLTVGIVPAEDADATHLRRWFAEGADIRDDAGVTEEVLAFIDAAGARSIVMTDRIIGCPHKEGIDYEGPNCPACPFWAGRDRWTAAADDRRGRAFVRQGIRELGELAEPTVDLDCATLPR